MTYTALNDELLANGIWQVRANRRISRIVVECAIREWSDPYLPQTENQWFRREYIRRVRARSKSECQTAGVVLTVIAMAILSAVVSFVVRKLLEWYFEDRATRGPLLWKFRREVEQGIKGPQA